MAMTKRLYRYRGRIERPTRRNTLRGPQLSYRWRDGYSEDVDGAPSYPWLTQDECRREAEASGCRAVFQREKLD